MTNSVIETLKAPHNAPAKAQQQPTTANIVQKVIAIDKAPKSYCELASEDEKYQTWVPPKGQTGNAWKKAPE